MGSLPQQLVSFIRIEVIPPLIQSTRFPINHTFILSTGDECFLKDNLRNRVYSRNEGFEEHGHAESS